LPIKILDNKKEFVYKELEDNIKKGSKLSIISGYFTIYAYSVLKKKLNNIDNLRFIFKEPIFLKANKKEVREYYIDNINPKDIFGNEFELKLRNEMTQGSIAKDCAEWIRKKVEVKSFKTSDTSQPRMIYVDNPDGDSLCINGTPDFTTDGLGITPSNRTDVNTAFINEASNSTFLDIFDDLWENNQELVDVKNQLLDEMEVIYKENPGEFIYFVSMFHLFKEYLGELDDGNIVREGTRFKETSIWNKLYKFQKDAVIGAIDKIEKYNGLILADSVGLGKTFTALAIIKYYELRNDRVLVLVPKKLRDNWTIFTQNDKRNIFVDDRFRYDILNHTDLSRDKGKSGDIDLAGINWGNYDLVVIDESHNFRNNPAVNDRQTRYEKLMDDIIKSGVKTKVLMLSATPVNIKMTDLRNQISFISEENDKHLNDMGIDSIDYTLRKAQEVFNNWSKLEDEYRTSERFVNMINMDYFKLLDTLTIARSRKHIEKYYNIEEIGKFPKRLKPINKYADIDTKKEFPEIKDINSIIKQLKLAIYAPTHYILPPMREKYADLYDTDVGEHGSTFKQSDRESQLVGLVRINMLKRLESSIHSFKLTISRILFKINDILEKIYSGISYDPNIDIKDIDPEQENYDELMFGKKQKVLFQDMDLVKWKQDLELDKKKLKQILSDSEKIKPERDKKLQILKEIIQDKVNNPINVNNNKENKKVIVFTTFADTAKYLYENIASWAKDKLNLDSGMVTGSGSNKTTLKLTKSTDINDILMNFSPISKEREKIYGNDEKIMSKQIDILIGTDCISEGQNLQDCDFLINYDIHWNPVRIIQRFGRIDRLGSINNEIQLLNFWPNMELDEYINLTSRVEDRMVIVDATATGDENIIAKNTTTKVVDFREKQLKKLQEEVVDLEDVSGGISITDLTFNDFKVELMEYMKDHKKELEDAPSGIYSIVKIDDDLKEELNPGVIFLLKQSKGSSESKQQNPLIPYYLIYVNEESSVVLNYNNSKKIMDLYKKLCTGKRECFKELIAIFNQETKHGKKMDKYSNLLKIAIDNILDKKQDLGTASLFSKGGTNPVKNDIVGLEEFELITFLVLK
jgi:SNF2 family DNA or RNA helicase